jgi:hypothetical protein
MPDRHWKVSFEKENEMLESTDRLALAVHDVESAIDSFDQIFGCVLVDDLFDAEACARRVTLQWGRSQLELMQPMGPGPVGDFLHSGRSGVFLGGFSLQNPAELAEYLRKQDIQVYSQENDRFVVFPNDCHGTGVILSKTVERERIGLCNKIWQITYAVENFYDSLNMYSRLFKLGDMFTNTYESELYGYRGAITWFDARDGGRLDSLEYLKPNRSNTAVDRFVKRNGNGIYMASIETDDVSQIKQRVTETGTGWTGTEFGGFIHPKRLHGLLVGLVTYSDWNSKRPLPESALTS